MDGFGGADGSVGEEESSEGGEDGVGHGDAAVDRQVKPDIRARAVGRRRLDRRGRRRPGRTDGREGFKRSLMNRFGACFGSMMQRLT